MAIEAAWIGWFGLPYAIIVVIAVVFFVVVFDLFVFVVCVCVCVCVWCVCVCLYVPVGRCVSVTGVCECDGVCGGV